MIKVVTSDDAACSWLLPIDCVQAAAELAPSAFVTVLAVVVRTDSVSSYPISQIVIYGNLKALSPAARYFPSEENLTH